MVGRHLIVDIYNIIDIELLKTAGAMSLLMENITRVGGLNVVGQLSHQFTPEGATIIYLLAESHLSIHTYPELHYCAIDLYCCNDTIGFDDILEEISKYFSHECCITKKIIQRG